MPRLTVLVLTLLVLALQHGCATYVAVSMEGPADDELVKPGMQRTDVEAVLKTGPASEFKKDERTNARYEYADGPEHATKARALVYVAGDVFLLFLSELIFWPIELYADGQIQRVGLAEYDASFVLRDWKVTRTAGEVVESTHLGEDGEIVVVVERDGGAREDTGRSRLRRRRQAGAGSSSVPQASEIRATAEGAPVEESPKSSLEEQTDAVVPAEAERGEER